MAVSTRAPEFTTMRVKASSPQTMYTNTAASIRLPESTPQTSEAASTSQRSTLESMLKNQTSTPETRAVHVKKRRASADVTAVKILRKINIIDLPLSKLDFPFEMYCILPNAMVELIKHHNIKLVHKKNPRIT
ncbi:hypothetical protein PR048_016482 [Dryococelus australis]|uniref:Uncharacterized protein n=1 Tax=Dryococelus australis TaxID=614101 RepID=A0ABQ9HJU4_9NEOP|nr:hypothetical protein PR048_016482 [Dryococelus australis]